MMLYRRQNLMCNLRIWQLMDRINLKDQNVEIFNIWNLSICKLKFLVVMRMQLGIGTQLLKKSISMCIGSSASRSKSPRLENKQQLTTNLVVQSNEPKDIVCINPFEALEVEK